MGIIYTFINQSYTKPKIDFNINTQYVSFKAITNFKAFNYTKINPFYIHKA